MRLTWARDDVGLRRAWRADVRRPRDVKWLPAPSGDGDAADIVCSEASQVDVVSSQARARLLESFKQSRCGSAELFVFVCGTR